MRSVGLTQTVWIHYPEDQIKPQVWERPSSLDDLYKIVNAAVRTGRAVKAVGAGHASSDAPVPRHTLVTTDHLNRLLENEWLKGKPPGISGDLHLIRVQAGIKIKDLNDALHGRDLALANMGNYDGQSIYGAICTGTHGSNLSMGPLADAVLSLELVTAVDGPNGPEARLIRIEPTNGITDPQAFRNGAPGDKGWELIQDDKVFYASVVSMGCFGIAFALTLKVVPRFKLKETHAIVMWSKLKQGLPERVKNETEFFEFVIFPHKHRDDDDYPCLVTRRSKVASSSAIREKKGFWQSFQEWFGRALDNLLGTQTLGEYLSRHGDKVINTFQKQFDRMANDESVDWSHKIFPLGYGAQYQAWSNEIAVPLGKAVLAVNAILELARRCQAAGYYHTAPVGVRFVGHTQHFMAMQFKRDTCMIETPLLVGTVEAKQILSKIEEALYDLTGRPHWGQWHKLQAKKAKEFYTNYGAFHATYRRFNYLGLFSNSFSDRVFGSPTSG